MITDFQANLQLIRQRIDEAKIASSRSAENVQLLAVSKTRSVQELKVAITAGQQAFAENYLQEALDKMAHLDEDTLTWHFIGAIQSNKTRSLAQHFDWLHTLDRIKIAERLSHQRPSDKPPLNVLIQINLNDEINKAGIRLDALEDFANAIIPMPNLRLRGLMTIPAPTTQTQQQLANFAQMKQALQKLNQRLNLDLDQLSMGMSQDFEAAIREGATMVRIGTALFGRRV